MATQKQHESAPSTYITSKEDAQPVSQAVLEAIAELSSRAVVPTESSEGDASTPLPPLYEAVNPDALNAICQSATGETEVTISFTYCGYEVSVKNGEQILIFERDE